MPITLTDRADVVHTTTSDGMVLAAGPQQRVYVRDVTVSAGGVTLMAQYGSGGDAGHGGLWHSKLADVHLHGGATLHIEGGAEPYLLPMQDIDFERIVVERSNAPLKIGGQVAQCRFHGGFFNGPQGYAVGVKALETFMKGNEDVGPSTIVFTGTAFQDAEVGAWLHRAHNFHFINCWFENVSMGIVGGGVSTIRLTNCIFLNVTQHLALIDGNTTVIVDNAIVQGTIPQNPWAIVAGGSGTYVHR